MAILHVSGTNFDAEVLSSTQTVLVDFYADWCGPCKMLSPVIDEIAGENPQVKVVKLNVDNAPEIAARYGVMSIPTLIVFKGGEVTGQTVGFQSKQAILAML
ncbi:MAG: thioredoxin [Clostridiales bacterium]|nr:thioredoxin [Clostridiales bacterium]